MFSCRITKMKVFPEKHYKELIRFCTVAGLVDEHPAEFDQVPSDYDFHCYDDAATVTWMDVPWTAPVAKTLKRMKKNWTDSLRGRELPWEDIRQHDDPKDPIWDDLPEAYRLLLMRCCRVADCDMPDLLLLVNGRFERHISFTKVSSSSKSSSKSSSRPPSRSKTPI